MDDVLEQARNYDSMINWTARIERELPLILDSLPKGKVLDLACASGRHSFALEKHGFEPFGIDISEGMIALAREIAAENGSRVRFINEDLTLPNLKKRLATAGFPTSFEGAILLGNAIANMGSLQSARAVVENVRDLLKDGGRLVLHTINRPKRPHYIALRQLNEQTIVQRIMVPVNDQPHNVELNVNFIDVKTLNYSRQSVSPLYMFTKVEMDDLLKNSGFEIVELFGGFGRETPSDEDGASLVWIAEKI